MRRAGTTGRSSCRFRHHRRRLARSAILIPLNVSFPVLASLFCLDVAGTSLAGIDVRIGSLFSGIGGLELGLEWSGVGHTVWQVEYDEFCRSILARHWPHATRFHDIRDVSGGILEPVDLICGGFPCQDVSSAGARKGLAGERSGLWREFARVVSECKPEWVVVENVASGAKLWVDTVVQDLGQLGYETLPVPISASDCGALHRRARIFIVAHTYTHSQSTCTEHEQMVESHAATSQASDFDSIKLRKQSRRWWWAKRPSSAEFTFPDWSSAEPSLVRVADGVSHKLDSRRIKALGNAVVPQCAEVIGNLIRELL